MRLFDQNLYILCDCFLIWERRMKAAPYSQALLGMIDSQSKAKGMGCAWLRVCRHCLARLGYELSPLALGD